MHFRELIELKSKHFSLKAAPDLPYGHLFPTNIADYDDSLLEISGFERRVHKIDKAENIKAFSTRPNDQSAQAGRSEAAGRTLVHQPRRRAGRPAHGRSLRASNDACGCGYSFVPLARMPLIAKTKLHVGKIAQGISVRASSARGDQRS